ncbi:MAG: hypothetical protein K6E33_07205, partial [Lachnospiraceae bacterium]|nr:hypothetical protein [Lachnospiraceae bacterium]
MITVFRIDDVTPYMDREPFERALGILTGAGAFPLLGVVPDLMDETLSLDIPKDSAGRFRKLKEFSSYVNDLSGRGCVISM